MNKNRTIYNRSDYQSIKDLFIVNRDRWYSGNFLKKEFKISTQVLQKIIHDLRVNGITIVSGGTNGYKYTTDKEEVMSCYLSLKGRAEAIDAAARGIYEGFIENIEGNHPI